MLDLNADQIERLIELAGQKSFFDYLSLFLQTLVPLGALVFGYSTLKTHARRITAEKLIEKDIDRLYQSVDHFFEYADKINLFFSLQLTKINKRHQGKPVEESLDTKLKTASDLVYENIANVRKASFILSSLGKPEIARKLDNFRDETIQIRKSIFNSLDSLGAYPTTSQIETLINYISTEKERASKLRDECLFDLSKISNELKKPFQ